MHRPHAREGGSAGLRTELWMGRKAPLTMRGNMARILATGSSFSSAVSRNGKHLRKAQPSRLMQL